MKAKENLLLVSEEGILNSDNESFPNPNKSEKK